MKDRLLGRFLTFFNYVPHVPPDSETTIITVNNINRCPILAEIGNRLVNEGSSLTINLAASDPDNDPLIFSTAALPAGATFIDNGDSTATFSWTPNYDDSGSYEVTFKVSDGACPDQDGIIITVGNLNRPPVLDPIADIRVNEGEIVTITPTASDLDGDTLTFSYSAWMSTDTYTTNYNDAGAHTVIVTVSDGDLSDSQEVTVTVIDVLSTNMTRPNPGDRVSGNAIIIEATTWSEDVTGIDFYSKPSD
ncbi:MAG: Ig-like domain-containing protein, partial [bacterium]|nr:Ig-like domain-containing protein [bacterium]